MQLYLFSGFLGSGKTTLILGFAKILVEHRNKKVMLIVNDVGDVGIDGQLMRQCNTDVYELFGGCICGQLGNLVNLLQKAGAEYVVDAIILEASGIAQPARFLDTIRKFGPDELQIKVIALVDASRWLELRQVVEDLVTGQVRTAEYIFVNKIDATDAVLLQEVINDIAGLKLKGKIIALSASKAEDILKIAEVLGDA